MRCLSLLSFALAAVLLTGLAGCAGKSGESSTHPATAMGSWPDWQSLQPLVQITAHHVQPDTQAELEKASALLAQGKILDADRVLAAQADGVDRQWIAVARADLAALHFTRCIRGVAWRLENFDAETTIVARETDYSPTTKLGAADVSVEAMLTDLDSTVARAKGALLTQARIARARVTAFAAQCPPNDDVAQLAQDTMRSDLATLVAQDQLPPDLAYLWAGVQMQEFSGSAARPFLLRAQEGGFDTPALDYTLAAIAFERREFARADELATRAAQRFDQAGDIDQWAQTEFLRGEIAAAQASNQSARKHYVAALKRVPDHVPALLGLTRLTARESGSVPASTYLHDTLVASFPAPPLDVPALTDLMHQVEAIAVLTERELDLSEICREALLIGIDGHAEASVRGILYFYAATLDVRLGDYVNARGHAVLARDELDAAGHSDLIDIERFLAHLDGGT